MKNLILALMMSVSFFAPHAAFAMTDDFEELEKQLWTAFRSDSASAKTDLEEQEKNSYFSDLRKLRGELTRNVLSKEADELLAIGENIANKYMIHANNGGISYVLRPDLAVLQKQRSYVLKRRKWILDYLKAMNEDNDLKKSSSSVDKTKLNTNPTHNTEEVD